MKYKLLLILTLLSACTKDDDIETLLNTVQNEIQINNVNVDSSTTDDKFNFSPTNRNYNQPHHITRNSPISWINAHDVMISLGRNLDVIGPDNMGAAFADWNGDGYEDFIAAVQVTHCWTCEGAKPELYLYDPNTKDFYYEEMKFTHSSDEILNRNGIKLIGDFDSDGDPDLLFGGYEDHNTGNFDKVWILENNYSVDGTFIPHDLSNFIQKNETATVDIDGDGDLDIFVIQENDLVYQNKPVFLINEGNFNFTLDESRFEYYDSIDFLQLTFYDEGDGNSILFEDINNDGFIDILWNTPIDFWSGQEPQQVKDILVRKNKILWGSEEKYSMDNQTLIPSVDGWMLIDTIEPWDYNNDGIKELVVVRDFGTDWNTAHSGLNGFYIQLLKLDEKELIDITYLIEDNYKTNGYNLNPTTFIDFDNDGYLSLSNIRTTYDRQDIYRWEWDGNVIRKN